MKRTKINFFNNKGVTLVALVITIIILLLLAGIVITQLTGDNGLFIRAKQAKNNTLDAQNAENMTIADYENKIDEIVEKSTRDMSNLSVEYKKILKINTEYVNTEKSKITVAQYGNLITITGTITLSKTSGYGQVLYLEDLPKPVEKLYFIATDENAQKINIMIDSDGKLYNYWSGNTVAEGKEIRFSNTYICK